MSVGEGDLEQLIGRVAAGDRAAFARLYSATSAKLFGIVLRIVGDRALGEDVLQETFLRVWRNASRFDPASGRPVTWLASLARNAAIDTVRQRAVLRARHDDDPDAAEAVPDPAPGVASLGDRDALGRCLGELEDAQRTCVLLAYVEGWSREELADRFDRPVGTIKTWLHRGLNRLKDCLERT